MGLLTTNKNDMTPDTITATTTVNKFIAGGIGGGGVAVYGGLTASDWAVFSGIVVGGISSIIAVLRYLDERKERKQRMRLAQEIHDKHLKDAK